jgi:hypothetical protein
VSRRPAVSLLEAVEEKPQRGQVLVHLPDLLFAPAAYEWETAYFHKVVSVPRVVTLTQKEFGRPASSGERNRMRIEQPRERGLRLSPPRRLWCRRSMPRLQPDDAPPERIGGKRTVEVGCRAQQALHASAGIVEGGESFAENSDPWDPAPARSVAAQASTAACRSRRTTPARDFAVSTSIACASNRTSSGS